MAEERAGRKGKRYVGVDLPTEDYLELERLAAGDDCSVGRLVRMGVKMLLAHQRKWDELGPVPEDPAVTEQALRNVWDRHKGMVAAEVDVRRIGLNKGTGPTPPHLQVNVAPPKRPIAAKQFDPPTDEPEEKK